MTFFFYACVTPFSCQGPLGVSANLSFLFLYFFFLFDFRFFLFIRSLQSHQRKRIAPSLTPQCSSYWKGNLRINLYYGCQLYLLTYYSVFISIPPSRPVYIYLTSILLYGCTTWTLTKRLEKKLDGNYTRMLRAILNKSWRQHPTRHQLYGHLPPITKTIQVRRTRHAGHCWRSRDELIRDVLLWTPTHGRAKAGRPARTYI